MNPIISETVRVIVLTTISFVVALDHHAALVPRAQKISVRETFARSIGGAGVP